jgi:hypothetical protein
MPTRVTRAPGRGASRAGSSATAFVDGACFHLGVIRALTGCQMPFLT